jgi:LysR family transcriptional regulator, cys regulon transcriptional activator
VTLQQLRYLCAVADCGFNISRAADVLHTSQPGISKQIGLLEEELNTAIFVRRKGRMVDISERGAQVLEIARRILKDANSLRCMGDEFVQAEGGRLAVAVLHIHARYLLLDVITQFKRAHPAVRIDLLQGTPGRVSDLVLSGEADIGVSIDPLTGLAGLLQIACRPVPRSVIVPARHPLLRTPRPTLEDIARYPVIAVEASSAVDWEIRRAFQSHGIELDIAMQAADATVIKAYVESGIGIAMLPTAAFEPQRDRGLRAIDAGHLFGDSQLNLLLDPYRYLRGFAYDFIELVAPRWPRAEVEKAMALRARQERARSHAPPT